MALMEYYSNYTPRKQDGGLANIICTERGGPVYSIFYA